MNTQNYSRHARYVPGYHFVTLFIILTINVLAVINFLYVVGKRLWLYTGLMPLLVSIVLLSLFVYAREFALSVQDRAIRAEEKFQAFYFNG